MPPRATPRHPMPVTDGLPFFLDRRQFSSQRRRKEATCERKMERSSSGLNFANIKWNRDDRSTGRKGLEIQGGGKALRRQIIKSLVVSVRP